jgi:hypothetical protein
MECSQVYVLFTTNNLDNQTIKRQLITNFEVWLEAVGGLLEPMAVRMVVAGNWFVALVAKHQVEKLVWQLVEAVGTGLGLLDSVAGTDCLKDQPF